MWVANFCFGATFGNLEEIKIDKQWLDHSLFFYVMPGEEKKNTEITELHTLQATRISPEIWSVSCQRWGPNNFTNLRRSPRRWVRPMCQTSPACHQIPGDVGARPKSCRKCSHDLYTKLYMVMICLGALWMLKHFDDVCYQVLFQRVFCLLD